MGSLHHVHQAVVIEAFDSTSRYLNDLLNIDNPYFEGIVNQIYPPELQLNKKVQVGKDQEKAQSEKKFPLQKPRWEKTKLTIR